MDHAEWAQSFALFVENVRPFLSRKIPGESQLLHDESQLLEPMYFKAQEHAAHAIGFYYHAKNEAMDRLMQDGWPKSSLDATGKAQAHLELKSKELAERLVLVVQSRAYKVAQALKLMEGK